MQSRRLDLLGNWLRVERNFNIVFACIAGFITFWKGFRPPYDWAATQAQFDYRFGLVRLGLFGQICAWLHLRIIDYRVFTVVSYSILFLLFFLLFRLAIRSGLATPLSGLFIVLIAASYSISFTINVVGYLDGLLMLVVLLALGTRGRVAHLVAVSIAAIIGCLLHELYLVAFLPLSLMNLVCRAEDEGFNWRNILAPLLLSVVPALVVIKLCGHVALTQAQMQSFLNDWHAHANFRVRDDFFGVLTRPLSQCMREGWMYFRAGEWWIEEIFLGTAFFPAACFFLFVTYRFLGDGRKWSRRYVTLAVLCPMALNLVAVDFVRWMNFVGMNAIIAAVIAARGLRQTPAGVAPQRAFGSLTRNVAIVLIALNLATNEGMFAGGTNFTFLAHWKRFHENRLHHRPLLSFPD